MRQRHNQRGIIIVLAGVGLVITLAFVGLFADLGLAFVTKARMSKAVDAAALAAARNTAKGNATMRTLALDVAGANYTLKSGTYDVTIDTQSIDTTRVVVTGAATMPTMLFSLLGQKTISMRAFGEATRFPLDLTLVLDVSKSLEYTDSFDDLQAAAKAFVARFDPNIDQLGLVTFSTVGKENVTIRKNFSSTINTTIDGLSAIAWTNIDEGLRIGKTQLDTAPVRTRAIKVAVLFTDGRPTAFRDKIDVTKNPPNKYDGVVTVDSGGSAVQGLYEPVNGDLVTDFDSSGKAVTTSSSFVRRGSSSALVSKFPNGAATGPNALAMAYSQAEDQANDIRKAGYRIYAIGLGNMDSEDPEDQPDLTLLTRIANVRGATDSKQPMGHMIYAPSAADLNAVFSQVADRILTRLTR